MAISWRWDRRCYIAAVQRRSIPWTRLSAEAFLIVLSVLLALFLDESRARRADARATRAQLEAIGSELRSNLEVVQDWSERHGRMAQRLEGHWSDLDEARTRLFDGVELDLQELFGESLLDNNVRSTAWQTARTTGVVRHFDPSLTAQLTSIYDLQSDGALRTLSRITDLLFERATHRPEQLAETLAVMRMLFGELRGQEALLLGSYEAVLAEVDAAAR